MCHFYFFYLFLTWSVIYYWTEAQQHENLVFLNKLGFWNCYSVLQSKSVLLCLVSCRLKRLKLRRFWSRKKDPFRMHNTLTIDSMLACICFVVDHRWYQNVITDISITFGRLLWSITAQTHDYRESICFKSQKCKNAVNFDIIYASDLPYIIRKNR